MIFVSKHAAPAMLPILKWKSGLLHFSVFQDKTWESPLTSLFLSLLFLSNLADSISKLHPKLDHFSPPPLLPALSLTWIIATVSYLVSCFCPCPLQSCLTALPELRALWGFPHHPRINLASACFCLPPCHSSPAVLAPSMSCKYFTSGPLHVLFPLSGMPFPPTSAWFALILQFCLCPSWTLYIKQTPPPLLCFIFFTEVISI